MKQTAEAAQVLGSTLEYAWFGDRATPHPLVLLHDSLGSVGTWKDFPERLAAATGHAVLAYSREGFGGSSKLSRARWRGYMHHEAETVLPAFLDAVGVKSPILFGHSDGATIALVAAGAHPGLTPGIVIEAPHVFVEPITLAGIDAAREVYRTTNLREKLTRYHPDPDAVFAAWTETWTAPYFKDWNVEEYVPRVRCPVLMIQGLQDEYGSAAQIEAIKAGRVDREVLMLDRCAHSPHRDRPEAVLKAAAEFVRRIA
ncbi:MAG: alpha/beta hydrolase [Rhodospirillaceae bacterium]|nr:alpha/beta hydrolase [Rhodospirillaceae bacterium]